MLTPVALQQVSQCCADGRVWHFNVSPNKASLRFPLCQSDQLLSSEPTQGSSKLFFFGHVPLALCVNLGVFSFFRSLNRTEPAQEEVSLQTALWQPLARSCSAL